MLRPDPPPLAGIILTTPVRCDFMETFVVFFYPPLLAIAVDCRRQWTAMWTAMEGNGRQCGRQWTAMDGNGRQWSTMDGNGYAGSGEQSYFSDMICSENPEPVFFV